MSLTGIGVQDEVITLFNQFKLKRTEHYAIVMKIEGKEIIVDGHVPKASAEDEKTDLHAELVKRLPETEPRYVVVDWAYTTNDGRETDKVVLISWVPDSAKVKQKMLYSGTKSALTSALTGISIMINATDVDEYTSEAINAKCRSL